MRRLALTLTLGMAVIPAASQTPAKKPTFEVASIKQHVLPGGGGFFKNPNAPPFRISGSRVTLQLVTLSDLIIAAYNVKDYQVSGLPKWGGRGGDYYDVEAKAQGDSAPSVDQIRQMLQALLADRFQLQIHREMKELSVYDLVVGKNGPKLREIPPGSTVTVPTPPVRRSSIEQLDSLISNFLDRPLIDKTGLVGTFEYSMDWGQLDLDRVANNPTATIYTAVQEQLELRLESDKERVEFLVIDSVQRPSEN
jgi:uncharacterized protein (TIGR03435 family)